MTEQKNIGWTKLEQGRYEEALFHFVKRYSFQFPIPKKRDAPNKMPNSKSLLANFKI